ncbi:MAG TPA: alpha-2-macroglobulin family protein [Planctomycetota bacterium]|nr:alpha-2-macroglobulin family protein [Planctomycetota bacterium]
MKPIPCIVANLLVLSATVLFSADDEWNLPAAQRVSEAEDAAARGDRALAQCVLQRLESEAAASVSLTDRAAAAAHSDRVRLALGRAHTRAGNWELALPLFHAIALEGKSAAVQRAICAATLDALKPLLLQPDGRVVAPWTPIANDKHGPRQPDAALRAPYTRISRRDAAARIDATIGAWQRIAENETQPKDGPRSPNESRPQGSGNPSDSERATLAALDAPTIALVRYAWGLSTFDDTARVIEATNRDQKAVASLRFARLLLDERDLRRALSLLLALERAEPRDEPSNAAAEELLRIHIAYERLSRALPMLDPDAAAGLPQTFAAAVQPYLKDPAWAARREKIARELDAAFGTVDLSIVLGNASFEAAVQSVPKPVDKSNIEIPPDILAKAELGDHFEIINPDLSDFYKGDAQTVPEKKRNRYSQLGLLAGVLHKNLLPTLNPQRAGAREFREEYELQIDHQEFLIEASSENPRVPASPSPDVSAVRPLSPSARLRLTILTRYHGTIEIEARRLPNRDAFEKLDNALTPAQIAALPVAKSYSLQLKSLADNLEPDPTKQLLEIKEHGLTPGFYVLLARARYSPVVAISRLAVSDARLIARHSPSEILLWSIDRLTGAPRPAAKLSGELMLLYSGETAWGDKPLPSRTELLLRSIDRESDEALAQGRKPYRSAEWERTEFLKGFGDALNDNAQLAGSDSYLAGVTEAKKHRDDFPPQRLPLPPQADGNGLSRIALSASWRGHACRIRARVDDCEVDALDVTCALKPEHTERVVEWVADRPEVRPGQSVRLRGFVRESRDGRLALVHGGEMPLALSLNGAALFDSIVPIDAAGVCVFEQLIDPDARDGTLVATSAGKSKPLCIVTGGALATRQLRLELPAHPVAAGSRVKGKAVVESAAGVPLAGVPVTLHAYFTKYAWEQNLRLPFGDNFARGANSGALMQGWDSEQELLTNQNGVAEFTLELPEDQSAVGHIRAFTASAEAPQTLHSAVEQYGTVLGMGSDHIVRVERFDQPALGKPAALAIEARTLSGEPYTQPFEVSDDEGHILATFTPGADARGHADVQPMNGHGFKLRAAGARWLPIVSTQPQREVVERRGTVLAAQVDKNEYRLGETAVLTLRTDRPNLTALFTTENSAITRAELLTIPARSKQLEIKLTEQDSPDTTVALTVLADDQVDCVLLPLNIARAERELAVTVSADRNSAEPGETVQLTASVRDSRGAPVSGAEVVLAVYDRRLLPFSGDPAPRFGDAFWSASHVPHSVEWSAAYHTFTYGAGFLWLAPEWSFGPYAVSARGLYADSGAGHGSFGNRSGGGRRLMVKRHGGSKAAESLRVRSRFSEQALWLTELKTAADGTVRAPLLVPDALTTYRAVAYALDARGDAGSGTFDLSVHRDVELALELPSEFREGDRTEVALTVYNHSEKNQRMQLKPNFALPILSARLSAAPLPETLDVDPHSSATVRYLLGPASATGGALSNTSSLRFEISANSPDGKTLDQAIFESPLRMAGRPEREVTQAILREKDSVHVPFAGSFDAQRTTLTVTLRRGLKGLGLDVRDLQFIFPEHCLEQTLSRFVPAVALADALPNDNVSPEERARLEGVLHSGVVRLRTLGGGSELQPLIAWYLRRLAALPAGRAEL